MRIGIISDSHGKRTGLNKAINRLGKVDLIFHLGDLYTDAIHIENSFGVETVYVRGNCDFSEDADLYREVEYGGKRFYLTHGHTYRVKWDLRYLIQATKDRKYDVVFYGHTHMPHISFKSGVIFMNPGSVAEPRGGKRPTIGLIEINNNRIIPYILNLDE